MPVYIFCIFFLVNMYVTIFLLQVLGAAWYVLSVDRYTSCWKSICKKESSPEKCSLDYLDCSTFNSPDRRIWANNTNVFKNCDPNSDGIDFKFGIFENAVTKNVVSSNFIPKYFYCLWWGLQQLRYVFVFPFHKNQSYLGMTLK